MIAGNKLQVTIDSWKEDYSFLEEYFSREEIYELETGEKPDENGDMGYMPKYNLLLTVERVERK